MRMIINDIELCHEETNIQYLENFAHFGER